MASGNPLPGSSCGLLCFLGASHRQHCQQPQFSRYRARSTWITQRYGMGHPLMAATVATDRPMDPTREATVVTEEDTVATGVAR